MLTYLLAAMIISSAPGEPTEIEGSAATPDGGRKEITVEQPEDASNPFGYIAPEDDESLLNAETQNTPQEAADTPSAETPPPSSEPAAVVPLVSQSSTVNPRDMNPLHYQNQIENTIYQSGDRLIDVQSIPLKDISSAVQPNIQPTITDYPSL